MTKPKATTTVPHVVRVTFLGVAGIRHTDSSSACCPPLRAAASISRTKTARGISCREVSGCLRRVDSEAKAPSGRYALKLDDEGGVEILVDGATTRSVDGRRASEQVEGTNRRYVAVWEKRTSSRSGNTLAFEAELRPSDDTKFAPKTFCVMVGLTPDWNRGSKDNHDDDSDAKLDGRVVDNKDGRVVGEKNQCPFAIPIGFANLVITGEETLNGEALQMDLPLESLSNFVGSFGSDQPSPSDAVVFPLIDLGIVSESTTAGNKGDASSSREVGAKQTKKKGVVSRIFRRNHNTAAAAVVTTPSDSDNNADEDANDVQSIFQKPHPNAMERRNFLNMFNVDPDGDAVVRIGLEVFQRGSELEAIFRQKNRIRRELRRREMVKKQQQQQQQQQQQEEEKEELPTRTCSSGTGKSLIDDDIPSDSDDSQDTPSYFSLDSGMISGSSTWDESTYTNDYDTVSEMDATTVTSASNYVDSIMESRPTTSVLSRMFDCRMGGNAKGGGRLRNGRGGDGAVVPMQLRNISAGLFSCGSGEGLNGKKRELYGGVNNGGSIASPSNSGIDSTMVDCMSEEEEQQQVQGENERGVSDDTGNTDGMAVNCEEGGNGIALETTAMESPSAVATTTPPIERAETAVTVGNEESPMAVIVQRAPQPIMMEDKGQSYETASFEHADEHIEGLELTLEDIRISR